MMDRVELLYVVFATASVVYVGSIWGLVEQRVATPPVSSLVAKDHILVDQTGNSQVSAALPHQNRSLNPRR